MNGAEQEEQQQEQQLVSSNKKRQVDPINEAVDYECSSYIKRALAVGNLNIVRETNPEEDSCLEVKWTTQPDPYYRLRYESDHSSQLKGADNAPYPSVTASFKYGDKSKYLPVAFVIVPVEPSSREENGVYEPTPNIKYLVNSKATHGYLCVSERFVLSRYSFDNNVSFAALPVIRLKNTEAAQYRLRVIAWYKEIATGRVFSSRPSYSNLIGYGGTECGFGPVTISESSAHCTGGKNIQITIVTTNNRGRNPTYRAMVFDKSGWCVSDIPVTVISSTTLSFILPPYKEILDKGHYANVLISFSKLTANGGTIPIHFEYTSTDVAISPPLHPKKVILCQSVDEPWHSLPLNSNSSNNYGNGIGIGNNSNNNTRGNSSARNIVTRNNIFSSNNSSSSSNFTSSGSSSKLLPQFNISQYVSSDNSSGISKNNQIPLFNIAPCRETAINAVLNHEFNNIAVNNKQRLLDVSTNTCGTSSKNASTSTCIASSINASTNTYIRSSKNASANTNPDPTNSAYFLWQLFGSYAFTFEDFKNVQAYFEAKKSGEVDAQIGKKNVSCDTDDLKSTQMSNESFPRNSVDEAQVQDLNEDLADSNDGRLIVDELSEILENGDEMITIKFEPDFFPPSSSK